MYYRIDKGTDTFQKLSALWEKITAAHDAAKEIVEELGVKYYARASHALAGGISAIQFFEKPEGWVKVGRKNQSAYMPNAKRNKEIYDRIHALPVVHHKEMNDITGYQTQTYTKGDGIVFSHTNGLFYSKDCFLIEVDNEAKFTPNQDMVEIVTSEFMKLKNEQDESKVAEETAQ